MISRPPSAERHTWENIQGTGAYTINHIHEGIFPQAHQTSARYPRTISEFEAVGLTPHWSGGCSAPYVLEARLRIGMAYVGHQTLPNGCQFIIGEVMEVHLPEEAVLADGHLDLQALGTIAISGLDHYHRVGDLGRLPYAKPGGPARDT